MSSSYNVVGNSNAWSMTNNCAGSLSWHDTCVMRAAIWDRTNLLTLISWQELFHLLVFSLHHCIELQKLIMLSSCPVKANIYMRHLQWALDEHLMDDAHLTMAQTYVLYPYADLTIPWKPVWNRCVFFHWLSILSSTLTSSTGVAIDGLKTGEDVLSK